MPVATNLCLQVGGKGVYTRNTHTVQTTRHLVCALVEFTTSVEYGQYNLKSRFSLFLMNVDRNTTAIVRHCDRVVRIDHDVDVLAITR